MDDGSNSLPLSAKGRIEVYLPDLLSILEYSVRPLAEIAAPLHEAFRQSGMTQEQLDDFTDELVREVRAEKQLRNG